MTDDNAVPSFPTSLGTSEGTSITLLGRDLANDLMGRVSFGELAYWLITLRRPSPQQSVANSVYMTVDRNAEYVPPADT